MDLAARGSPGAAEGASRAPRGVEQRKTQHRSTANSRDVLSSLTARDFASAGACLADLEARGGVTHNLVSSLIRSCAKSGNPRAAVWCAERLLQSGVEPTIAIFNAVIDACARAGDLPAATRWWHTIVGSGLNPNRISYNTMLNACARSRSAEKAEWWIQDMVASGLHPCLISYSTVVDAWSKSGNLAKAESWFEKMVAAGQRPDAVIYNSLINVCAKAGKPVKAEELLQRMCESGIKADEKTYNSVISACAKGGAIQKAEYWFNYMEASGCKVDEITIGAVMNASAKAGDVERVEYYLREMPRRGLTPNVVCYNTMLHACAQKGDPALALRWFRVLVAEGLQPSKISFNSLIGAHMKVGDIASAEQWLEAMVKRGIDVDTITFSTLTRDYHGKNRPRSTSASEWAFGVIVKAYAAAGNASALRGWIGRMSQAGVSLSAAQLEDSLRQAPGHIQGVLLPRRRPHRPELAPASSLPGGEAPQELVAGGLADCQPIDLADPQRPLEDLGRALLGAYPPGLAPRAWYFDPAAPTAAVAPSRAYEIEAMPIPTRLVQALPAIGVAEAYHAASSSLPGFSVASL